MYDIFISHASRDKPAAEELRAMLVAAGYPSVFLDSENLSPGRSWVEDLYRYLRGTRIVVVLWSEHARQSPWVFAEWSFALAHNKPLMPVLLDSVPMDPLLRARQAVALTTDFRQRSELILEGLAAAGLQSSTLTYDLPCVPYPGLRHFEEWEESFFFGRAEDQVRVQQALDQGVLRARLSKKAQAVLLVGPSGCGKSSLLRAGILPRLRRSIERYAVVGPVSVSDTLFAHRKPPTGSTTAEVLEEAVATICEALSQAPERDRHTIVAVDPVEELLVRESTAASKAMLNIILAALSPREGSPPILLGTLRSDFVQQWLQHPQFGSVETELVALTALGDRDLAATIHGPAQKAGVEVEPALTLELLRGMEGQDALPLLAFALRRMWDLLPGETPAQGLTLAEYDAIGGLAECVRRAADAAVPKGLSREQDQALEAALLMLVQLDDGGRAVRRRAAWRDISKDAQPFIDRLLEARLLVAGGEGTERIVEVAHESVFQHWPRLSAWLADPVNRRFLSFRRRLAAIMQEASKDGVAPSQALRGKTLDDLRRSTRHRAHLLDDSERRFIRRAWRTAIVERSARWIAASVAIAAVTAASIFYGTLKNDQGVAIAERKAALEAARLAESVARIKAAAPLEAALLLGSIKESTVTEDMLATAADVLESAVPFNRVVHQSAVAAIEVAHNSNHVASASIDGEVLLWSPSAREITRLQKAYGVIPDHAPTLAFSRDDEVLAASGAQNNVQVWDLSRGMQPRLLKGHQAAISTLAFTEPGHELISGSADGRLIIWDIQSGTHKIFATEDSPVLSATAIGKDSVLAITSGHLWFFSRDGTPKGKMRTGGSYGSVFATDPSRRLLAVTASGLFTSRRRVGQFLRGNGNMIRIWNLALGKVQRDLKLPDETNDVESLAISRDGEVIAAGTGDGYVLSWLGQQESRAIRRDKERRGKISTIALAPSALSVAFATERSITVGSSLMVSEYNPQKTIRGHDAEVRLIRYSSDEEWLFSGAADGTACAWRLWQGDPTGQAFHSSDASVPDESYTTSRSGRFHASAKGNHVQITDSQRGSRTLILPNNRTEFPLFGPTQMEFSADDGHLAIAYGDNITLWRTADGTRKELEHVDPRAVSQSAVVTNFIYDRSGTMLLSNGLNGLQLWDVPTGRRTARVESDGADELGYSALTISDDGQLFAAGDGQGVVRAWSRSGTAVATLQRHHAAVSSLAFSAGSQFIASGDEDGVVRVWDIQTRRAIHRVSAGTARATSLFYRQDHGLLVGASDGSVKWWRDPDRSRPVSFGTSGSPIISLQLIDGQGISAVSARGATYRWPLDWPQVRDALRRRTTLTVGDLARTSSQGDPRVRDLPVTAEPRTPIAPAPAAKKVEANINGPRPFSSRAN